MSDNLYSFFEKYNKEYERTGKNKRLYVRYDRLLRKLKRKKDEEEKTEERDKTETKDEYRENEKTISKLYRENFDKIYVIHLNHEKERKEIFLRRNCHVPFDFIFFEGIYGKKDEDCKEILHKYLAKAIGYEGCSKIEKKYKRKMLKTEGQIGYLKSMLKIFVDARENRYKNIIVFDDDVILHKNFNNIFPNMLKKLDNSYHILRLGCTNHTIRKSLEKLHKPYFPTIDCDGSFAICYSEKTYDYFIEKIKEYNCPFDSGCLRDYRKEKKETIDFTCYDFLAIADVTKSSILEDRNLKELSKKILWNLNYFI
jgi:GR25 family glycosyltransferase involved in LPS biosynthesis